MSDANQCKNCGEQLNGKFCSSCGQRDITAGVTLRQTFDDFISANFAIEGPLWKTIRFLAINPGRLFREFVDGKRKLYYKPVQFFLVVTLVYLLFIEATGYDPLEGQFEHSPAETADQKRFFYYGQLAAEFMFDNINYVLFSIAISFGTVAKLLGWKRYRFAEYLTMGFYITGGYLIVSMPIAVAHLAGFEHKALKFVPLMLYIIYCCLSLWQQISVSTVIRAGAIAILTIFLYILLAFTISLGIIIVTNTTILSEIIES